MAQWKQEVIQQGMRLVEQERQQSDAMHQVRAERGSSPGAGGRGGGRGKGEVDGEWRVVVVEMEDLCVASHSDARENAVRVHQRLETQL